MAANTSSSRTASLAALTKTCQPKGCSSGESLMGRPLLEESHGISGPEGPNRFLTVVPFPSASNNAFTPYTTPSSRSQKGGGAPVHITNIRKLSDGRVAFDLGIEYY
jgi:hypothetical protein